MRLKRGVNPLILKDYGFDIITDSPFSAIKNRETNYAVFIGSDLVFLYNNINMDSEDILQEIFDLEEDGLLEIEGGI